MNGFDILPSVVDFVQGRLPLGPFGSIGKCRPRGILPILQPPYLLGCGGSSLNLREPIRYSRLGGVHDGVVPHATHFLRDSRMGGLPLYARGWWMRRHTQDAEGLLVKGDG